MAPEQKRDVLAVPPLGELASEKERVATMLAALAGIGVPVDGIQKRADFEAPERPGI
jgi:hypothetical protein